MTNAISADSCAGDLLALNPFRQLPIMTSAAFVQGWHGKDHVVLLAIQGGRHGLTK